MKYKATIIRRRLEILCALGFTVAFVLLFRLQYRSPLQPLTNYGLENSKTPLNESHTQKPQADRLLFINWSIWLGFNNQRYELEQNIHFARLTNRTIVIPSYIYLRQCLEIEACKLKGRPVQFTSIMNADSNSWSLPIEYFFDLTHLSQHARFFTISDFISMQLEAPQRQWSNDTKTELLMIRENFDTLNQYTKQPSGFKNILSNMTYQGFDLRRFLFTPPKGHIVIDNTEPVERFFKNISSNTTVQYTLYGFPDGLFHMAIDQNITIPVTVLPPIEWEKEDESFNMSETSTAGFSIGKNMHRGYSLPSYRSAVRFTGFAQQFSTQYADNIYTRAALLHMDNEAHRHTSQILKYSTPKGAELYEETVFKFLKYAPEVYEAAEHVLLNLTDKLEGRPFISMHFRRGDFATYQWLDGLESERTLLQTVGNAVTELNQWYASLGGQGSNASTAVEPVPTENPDKKRLSSTFLFATDEASSPLLIESLREMGGIRIEDVILNDATFTERFRDRSCFGDWLALVEQVVCVRAWHFVGSRRSSVTGGILNMRKGEGYKEEASTYIDEYQY